MTIQLRARAAAIAVFKVPLVLSSFAFTHIASPNPASTSKDSTMTNRASGTLHGRTGTFVLQHSGSMTRGVPQLSLTVVPDSGTYQLAGLTGKMTINIVEGKHYYEFEYTLAKTP